MNLDGPTWLLSGPSCATEIGKVYEGIAGLRISKKSETPSRSIAQLPIASGGDERILISGLNLPLLAVHDRPHLPIIAVHRSLVRH